MPRLPSRAELTSVLETELQNQYDPTGSSQPNLRAASRNSVFVSTATLGLMRLQMYVADRVGARLLSEAQGSDLDDLGRDLFGEERKEAVAATGRVQLIRPLGLGGDTTIPKGTRVGVKAYPSQPAVTYETTVDSTVPLGVYQAVIPIRAQQAGTIGNLADPRAITDILDPLPDPTWSVNLSPFSLEPVGGGADRETDDEYRRRLGQRSIQGDPGTKRGVEAGVGRVPGVYDWTVIEPGDGSIIVYASDNLYSPLTDEMISNITTELENWRPLGPPLYLRSYNAVTVGVVLELYMQRELKYYNQADIEAAARAAVKTYFETGRATPDEFFIDAIAGSVYRTNRELQHVAVTLPVLGTADVRRPDSKTYGSVQALNRYRVTDGSIIVNVKAPLTTSST